MLKAQLSRLLKPAHPIAPHSLVCNAGLRIVFEQRYSRGSLSRYRSGSFLAKGIGVLAEAESAKESEAITAHEIREYMKGARVTRERIICELETSNRLLAKIARNTEEPKGLLEAFVKAQTWRTLPDKWSLEWVTVIVLISVAFFVLAVKWSQSCCPK